jgi:restriction endonuclease S subunit
MYSVSLDNKDFRVDSQFYTKAPKKNDKLEYDKIGNLIHKAQYGISIAMNEEGKGYPIYRMNEIHNMMCDLEVNKYADISQTELDTFTLNDRDVLFNRTNSFEWVGRTGIYKKLDDRDFVFASYLVRFIPNQVIILPEYLSAFLNTYFGIWDIKRRARQSINQTNVNPEEVKQIEIPLLSMDIQDKIKYCFDNAHSAIVKSQTLYQEAEELLLNEIGMRDFVPSTEKVNIKSFSESFGSTGRLDAEYYQKKYDEMISTAKQNINFEILDNFVENYSTGYPYKSESYISKNGLPLIRINNINKGSLDISNSALIPNNDVELSPKDVAIENDILISMSGTIGNSCKIPKGVKAVINQRIMRITPKKYNNEVLPLIINSIVGELQLKRIGTGGVQTNISSTDIRKILIPIIDYKIQEQLAEKIEESFRLKAESEHLLEVAKRAVEIAIEEDEDVAMKYIKSETKNMEL